MSTPYFRIPFHPLRFPFHVSRSYFIQPLFWALFFLSPIFGWFRLDVIHNHMLVLNHAYPFQPQYVGWVPIIFFAGVLAIGVISILWGRLFCGWVCPHNTLTEWLVPLRYLIGIGRKPLLLQQWETRYTWMKWANVGLSLMWGLAVSWLIALLFTSYFVPLDWQLSHWQRPDYPFILPWGQALLMLIGLFMVYSGHEFCRNACPYGLLQSLSAYLTEKWTPMEIRYCFGKNQSACKSCHACQAACPVDIDPRDPENLKVGIGEGCFNCGKCIDACKTIHIYDNHVSYLYFQPPHATQVAERELSE